MFLNVLNVWIPVNKTKLYHVKMNPGIPRESLAPTGASKDFRGPPGKPRVIWMRMRH